MNLKTLTRLFLLTLLVTLVAASGLFGQGELAEPEEDTETASAVEQALEGKNMSSPVSIVLLMTALTLAPAILMTVTSFTRIIIVLSFVRRALAVQDLPPNQVVIGLSLFLTLATMNPTVTVIWDDAIDPYINEEIGYTEASEVVATEMRSFLLRQAHDEEIQLFMDLTNTESPDTVDELPLTVLIPAFALSEVKIAFKMGFLIYIPFLIVDIVISSILLAMGMFMLPPVIISTPFKILLFVMVDGWTLVIGSLMESFQVIPV